MTRVFLMAAFLFATGTEGAIAIDLKDLTPCKVAALRFCDRSKGMTAEALYTCGATLALRYLEISRACVAVLRRYRQLPEASEVVSETAQSRRY